MDAPPLQTQQDRLFEILGTRVPVEIRSYIWRSICDDFASEIQQMVYNAEADTQAGWSRVLSKARIIVVHRTGDSGIFRYAANRNLGLFRGEFLIQAVRGVTFACPSQLAFRNFVHNLNSCPEIGSKDVSQMRIKVPVFQGDDFSVLSEWEVVTGPHGLNHHAFGHIRRLVEEIKKLPEGTTVVLHMLRPWRNYLALRGWARELRDPPHGINLEVEIDTGAWNQIPNPDRHISLTIHAIKGIPYRPVGGITFAEAQDLVDHGCRGFRL